MGIIEERRWNLDLNGAGELDEKTKKIMVYRDIRMQSTLELTKSHNPHEFFTLHSRGAYKCC